jgi:hypothetical protein
MAQYKVQIIAEWLLTVDACNEDEAEEIALDIFTSEEPESYAVESVTEVSAPKGEEEDED